MNQQLLNQNNRDDGKSRDEKFCESCGEVIKIKAEICPKCGVRQKYKVNKAILLLLTFFLGGIGGHKFYIGKNLQGLLYFFFCWTSVPGFIALIEFITYAIASGDELQEKYEARSAGVVVAIVAAGIGFIFAVAILAAIAIPSLINYRYTAYCLRAEQDANMIAASIAEYFANHNPDSLPSIYDLKVTLSGNPPNSAVITGDINNIIITVTDNSRGCPGNRDGWNKDGSSYTKILR